MYTHTHIPSWLADRVEKHFSHFPHIQHTIPLSLMWRTRVHIIATDGYMKLIFCVKDFSIKVHPPQMVRLPNEYMCNVSKQASEQASFNIQIHIANVCIDFCF